MKRLLAQIAKSNRYIKEAPLEAVDIIKTQKKLVQQGYPFLPVEFIDFLKYHNGLSTSDSAVLGIPPLENESLNILTFNQNYNAVANTAILGYDDMYYLLFDNLKQRYMLVDRIGFDVIEEYLSDELVYAINSILHF